MPRNKPALDSPKMLLISSSSPLSCSACRSPLRVAASFLWVSPRSEVLMEMFFARAVGSSLSLLKQSLSEAPADPSPDNSKAFTGHPLFIIDE